MLRCVFASSSSSRPCSRAQIAHSAVTTSVGFSASTTTHIYTFRLFFTFSRLVLQSPVWLAGWCRKVARRMKESSFFRFFLLLLSFSIFLILPSFSFDALSVHQPKDGKEDLGPLSCFLSQRSPCFFPSYSSRLLPSPTYEANRLGGRGWIYLVHGLVLYILRASIVACAV